MTIQQYKCRAVVQLSSDKWYVQFLHPQYPTALSRFKWEEGDLSFVQGQHFTLYDILWHVNDELIELHFTLKDEFVLNKLADLGWTFIADDRNKDANRKEK